MFSYMDPIKIEKRNIMYHSNITGIAILCISLLSYPIMDLIYLLFNSVFSISPQQLAYYVKSNYILDLALNAFFTLIIFTVPFIIAAKILKFNLSTDSFFDKPQKGSAVLLCVTFGFGFILAGNYVSSIFATITQSFFGVMPTMPEMAPADNNVMSVVIQILFSAAIPALIEEFAFRGVLLGIFKRFGIWPAIIASSVLFAVMHANFVQIPFALIAGFSLALITIITNSIWPAILAHFLNNTFSAIGKYLPSEIFLLCFYLIILLGIISYVLLVRKKAFSKLKEDVPSCHTVAKRSILLLISPVMIVGIGLFIFKALSLFVKV